MIAIFAQTDKIMLKSIISDTATGYYSAAVACAGLSGFVFAAIIDSFRPVIFQNYPKNIFGFELNLKRLYSIIIYLSLLQSVFMTVFAKLIVLILYGSAYNEAIMPLRIIVWYTTFSYLGSIRNIWMLAKQLQKYLWIINLSGALLNVLLNFCFIPRYAEIGAAVASLITQIFTNFILGFIMKPIRDNNRIMIQSLNPKYIYELLTKRVSD